MKRPPAASSATVLVTVSCMQPSPMPCWAISEIWGPATRGLLLPSPFPDRVGEIVMSRAQALGFAHAKLMLAFIRQPDERYFVKEALALHTAYVNAIERVFGAPPDTLRRADASVVEFWIKAMRDHAAPPSPEEPR
ncbi:hypothetical protein ACFSQT_08315 [Mesorhizobium calcicola]|uniref:Uncharacterized protein n=1 Tax=Mesorhizobium calcicola TaxID=1300310 RepID=A0ABW4WAE2_9HYPH